MESIGVVVRMYINYLIFLLLYLVFGSSIPTFSSFVIFVRSC